MFHKFVFRFGVGIQDPKNLVFCIAFYCICELLNGKFCCKVLPIVRVKTSSRSNLVIFLVVNIRRKAVYSSTVDLLFTFNSNCFFFFFFFLFFLSSRGSFGFAWTSRGTSGLSKFSCDQSCVQTNALPKDLHWMLSYLVNRHLISYHVELDLHL